MTMFTDHSGLDDMVQVAALNGFRATSTRYGIVQSFWATPDRPADSPVADVLEISFTNSVLVNRLQFALARFPHLARIETLDDDGNWGPVIRADGSQAVSYVHDCVPATLPPPSAITGHQHPQHAFVGHWQSERISLRPVRMNGLRLVLLRQASSVVPYDVYGNPVDYSLAVRDLVIGFEVTALDDLPRSLPSGDPDGSYSSPVAASSDAVGSVVEYSVRTLGPERALFQDADAVWRCEPQPDPSCVVNFFLDVRQPDGSPQVIDRIWIDPINSGGHITAYFAVDEPGGGFTSSDSPLPPSAVAATASASMDGTQIVLGATDSIILDNGRIGYDPSQPWWIGLTVRPQFNPGSLSGLASLLDCDAWNLSFSSTGISFVSSYGDSMPLAFTYQSGVEITLLLGFDGQRYSLWADAVTNGPDSTSSPATLVPPPVTRLALGATRAGTNFAHTNVRSLVIKQESPPVDGTAYEADPRSFTRVEEYAADEPSTSRSNALLRFDPQTSLQSSGYPWALFGGMPSRYDDVRWTPIPRDYIAQRGWINLPATRARYWKLEFTSLPPVYADVFVPVSQVVRRFPPAELAAYRARQQAPGPTPDASDQAHAQVAALTDYDDAPVVVSTGGTGLGYTNTEVYVADDLAAADRLHAQRGADWAYQPFMTPQSAPRFTSTGKHVYDTEIIRRTSKVAYQIGLSSIRVARTVFSTQYDHPQYVEFFYDTAELDGDTSFFFDEDKLAMTSGSSTGAQILSKTYQSNRNVRGVQFAAQQSPARSSLIDSEFDDPTASRWDAVGSAVLGEIEPSTAFGHLLPVSRVLGSGTWGDIAPRYGTWGGIVSAGATWGDLARNANSPTTLADGNGIVSESVPVPAGGYVHAAARVIVDHDLFAPLYLQIVDDVTDVVLAESEATARRGQVVEWYCSYELGGEQFGGQITWGELAGGLQLPSFADSFTRANSTGLGRLDSGQIWQAGQKWNGTAGTGLDIVSNKAQVAATGNRSVIDVGTIWGQLDVTLGHIVTTAVNEMIYFGGVVVLNNGQVIDSETGLLYMTLTLADGDIVTMKSMPTAQVPPAQSSGADASIRSWSIVVLKNGTWVSTLSTMRAFGTVRGLAGYTGQTFTHFGWTPSNVNDPLGTVINQSPVPRDGGYDLSGTNWVQASDGRIWNLQGTAFTVVDNGIQQTLQATSAHSFTFSTDVGDMYGSLRAKIAVSGTTPAANYYVLKLDDALDYALYIRGDGHLIQFTPALGYVDLGAFVTSFSSATSILFANTSELSSAFMATWSLSGSYPQTLIAANGSTVVAVRQGTNLWRSTIRGVMGTDGSTVTGFTWAPDLGAADTGAGSSRTWGQISGNGTRTWGEVARSSTTQQNPVRARVVQKALSSDTWKMDSLDVFVDPLVWELSADGGQNWIAASTIRNNPNGVVLFDGGPGTNRLRYRVTSYAPDTWISHLVIRPWYVGHMRSVPVRAAAPHGPNLQPRDDYAPIEEDPHFMVWSLPIPREWWYAFRSILPGVVATTPTLAPTITERSVI